MTKDHQSDKDVLKYIATPLGIITVVLMIIAGAAWYYIINTSGVLLMAITYSFPGKLKRIAAALKVLSLFLIITGFAFLLVNW